MQIRPRSFEGFTQNADSLRVETDLAVILECFANWSRAEAPSLGETENFSGKRDIRS